LHTGIFSDDGDVNFTTHCAWRFEMRIALAVLLVLMLCLTGPAHIPFAFAGGGGGGGGGGDTDNSAQTSDPDEPPPGFILSGDPPSINAGLSGSTSGPGVSKTAAPPQSTTVKIIPGTGEGEPQDPRLTYVEQLNRAREAVGLEPRETVILPGGHAAVVNGKIVPVMGSPPVVKVVRIPMTRQRLMELNRQAQILNRRSRLLEIQERAAERTAFYAAICAAAIASGGKSLVAEKLGLGVAVAYTAAYAAVTSLIASRGDPLATVESTVGSLNTFELPAHLGPVKSNTIKVFHSVNSPGSVPVGGNFEM
jgi:hypothetical protein